MLKVPKMTARRELLSQASHWALLTAATAASATAAVAFGSRKAHAGWGRCSVSGCPCQAFQTASGYPNNCGNCGHRYEDHW